MKLEELEKLEDGALLECKGTNFLGKRVSEFIFFEKKNLFIEKKQYRVGCWIYPISWFSIPSLAKINAKIREIKQETEKRIERLTNGYSKTKNALTRDNNNG